MKRIIYKSIGIALIVLILVTIVHAFYQSSLPPAESSKESSKVGEIIEEIIPPETPPGQFVQQNLRKLAHFTEFFFLGLWSTLFVLFYYRKRWTICSLLPFGAFIAFCDETVQIFSERGPSVKDVWIDVLGYTCAFCLVFITVFAVIAVRMIFNRKHR